MKWLLLVAALGIVGIAVVSAVVFGASPDATKLPHETGSPEGLSRSM